MNAALDDFRVIDVSTVFAVAMVEHARGILAPTAPSDDHVRDHEA